MLFRFTSRLMGQQESGLVVRQEWMSLDGIFILLCVESGVMVAAIIRPRCSARQRYVIIFIVAHLFRIILLLPHLFLFPCLHVDYCRYLVADAHVRTVIVVEVYEPSDDVPCVPDAVEGLPGVDGFSLDDTIGALCDGVVRRCIVFGHTDSDVMAPKYTDITVTAVLHTTVRVVYKSFQRYTTGLRDGLSERLDGHGGTQRARQFPSYNHAGIGIRYQMKIAYVTVTEHNVGDVRYPQLVGSHGDEAFCEVLPLVVAVVRVGRVARLGGGSISP